MNFHGPAPAAPSMLELSWREVAGESPESIDLWTELVGRWSEPHRHYHGLAHLAAVLAIVDAHAELADDPTAVRLAAWFHDAVYDPRSHRNEVDSAELAITRLPDVGIGETTVAGVVRLIELTTTHRPADDDRDGALLCDADLAVLSSPPDAYVAYVNGVRAEYAHLSDTDFAAGRSEVLRALLDRDRLFHTAVMHEALEEAARRNLTAELTLLQAPRSDQSGPNGPSDPGGADDGSGPTGPTG